MTGQLQHGRAEGPLVSAATLASAYADRDVVVVDCRFNLLDPPAGRAAYDRGHIPGARYAHLDHDLARHPPQPHEGRHPLPDVDAFVATLGRWGIRPKDTVVAYDEGSGAIAARLWWLLRWVGHEASAVLDGGLAAWQALGLPLEQGQPRWQTGIYEPRRRDAAPVVSTGALLDRIASGALLLDARAAPRYRGEQEPIDPVAGHVPGAHNWPFSNNVTAAGTFRPAEELRAAFVERLSGREPAAVMAMCGSGVTACHLLLAMEVAGLPGGHLYAGSWSEWIRDPARPIASGEAP
jgi:thiosulfate/3-mercaptopyruvate sulfurtransferase